MSMLFDVDFFYRDFGKYLKLSTDSILLHYRFAGIIGSKHDFKISQKTLASQFGITERSLIRWLKPLVELGLMISTQDPNDKRKNRYSFPDFLPNYYQDRTAYALNFDALLKILPKKLSTILEENYFNKEKYMTELSPISTRYMTELSPISDEYMTELSPNFSEKNEISDNNQSLNEIDKKANGKRDINRKEDTNGGREKSPTFMDPNFVPTQKHIELAQSLNVDLYYECAQFVDWYLGKGEKRLDWNRSFNTWIRRSHKYQIGDKKNVRPRQNSVERLNELLGISKARQKQRSTIDLDQGDFFQI